MGRKIKILVNEIQSSGDKIIQWDSTNDEGHILSSGIYLCKIDVDNYVQTRKMILIK